MRPILYFSGTGNTELIVKKLVKALDIGGDMVESRCGILCSECEYKDQVNCKGGVNIKK